MERNVDSRESDWRYSTEIECSSREPIANSVPRISDIHIISGETSAPMIKERERDFVDTYLQFTREEGPSIPSHILVSKFMEMAGWFQWLAPPLRFRIHVHLNRAFYVIQFSNVKSVNPKYRSI